MSNPLPSVVPMLAYEDGVAALEWLARAFDFHERTRSTDSNGRLMHGEMDAGEGVIMLASPTPDYESPKQHGQYCEAARKWLSVPWVINGVLVHVDDVDSHYERAKKEGASILSAPQDAPPGRLYRVEDLEGQRWMFLQAAMSK